MNENIDLTKILENCPKGWKFYSTIYGEVEFEKIKKESEYPIVLITNHGNNCDIKSDGRYYGEFDGECTLFPSKNQRDWSNFTTPWYKNEQALSQTNERAWLYLVSDVLTWKYGIGQYLDDPSVQEIVKRLCSKYAQKLCNPSDTGKNEQKSADKIEPIYKVGDWVVRGNTIAQILDIQEQYYIGLDINGKDFVSSRFLNDDKIHLWTIQDAKDGDVLVSTWKGHSYIYIFKEIENNIIVSYVFYYPELDTISDGIINMANTPTIPATKEQRDTLMKAMNDAGYEWDAEKKELKKLVEVPDKFDPKTLNPFDKVLVRDTASQNWTCGFFSHTVVFNDRRKYNIGEIYYTMCIPYNEDTKHLVGTTDESPEFYRYWED